MVIDILQARNNIESLVKGIASGTGVSFGTKELIVYVDDYNKESEARSRIGDSYEGFAIKYVVSGNVKPLLFQ